MNTFRYDSTSIEYFDSTDLGSINDAPTSSIDRGTNFFDLIIEDGTEGVINNEFILETGSDFIVNDVLASEEYNLIVFTETTYPYGSINLGGVEEESASVVFIAKPNTIVLREKAIVIRKQAWTGSGTLFEIANGLERIVAPYIGGSGSLRVSGSADVSSTFEFTNESIKTYGSDADYGQVTTAVGSSIAYGQIDNIVDEGEFDNGDILTGQGTPFGPLKIRGVEVTSNRFSSYTGSGSFSLISTGSEQFDQPSVQIYVVGLDQATGQFVRKDVIGLTISGGDGDSFTRTTYYGSGSLFDLSGGLESKVYDYNPGSVVEYSIGTDNGSVNLPTNSSNIDYGQTSEQATAGEFDNGQVLIDQTTYPLTGLFKITGGDSAHARTYGEVGSGRIKTYKGQAVVNAGQSSDFAFLPHWRGRGGARIFNSTIPDAFSRPYSGSGSLFEIGQKDERAIFAYDTQTVGSEYQSLQLEDYQTINQSAGTTENYGPILSPADAGELSYGGFNTNFARFGAIKVNGSATVRQADDYTASYENSYAFVNIGPDVDVTSDFASSSSYQYKNGGMGFGSTGGFNIGPHYKVDGRSNGIAQALWAFDLTNVTHITVSGIRGNDSNGGNENNISPDSLDYYFTKTGLTQVTDVVFPGEQNFVGLEVATDGVSERSIPVPSEFRVSGVIFSLRLYFSQDEYGIKQVALRNADTNSGFVTVLPDELVSNYSASLTHVAVENSGTGSGSTGGFNSGTGTKYFRFGTSNVNEYRELTWVADASELSEFIFDLIAGNNSNGGNSPESADDLVFYWRDGNTFRPIEVLTDSNEPDDWKKVFSTIPPEARNAGQEFKLRQFGSGTFDNVGIRSIQFVPTLNTANVNIVTPNLKTDTVFVRGSATVQFAEPSPQVYVYGHRPQEASQGEFIKFGAGMSSIISVKGTYFGGGTLFNVGQNDERAVFDYNDSSIEIVQDPTDNGSLSSAGSTSDYGQVTQPSVGETSYGQVLVPYTIQPFGRLFEVTGGDIAHSTPKAYLGATAEIRITGGYSNLQFTSQAGESTVLFNTSGEDANSFSRPFIGSGSLFNIGDRIERTTYSYNISSITESFTFTDAESITTSASSVVDYGSVNQSYDAANSIDNGIVITDPDDNNPLGRLFSITGSSTEKFFPKFIWNRNSPAIRIFNDQQDPADFRFVPHWRSRHLLGTPKISNGPDGEFNTYAQSRPFIASGSLFSHGVKTERATVDYNSASIVEFSPGGDYGSVTNASGTSIDYGAINAIVTGGEVDAGQLVITETEYPLTGLFEFQGIAESQFIRGPYNARQGIIRIFNEQQDPADFRFSPHWRARPYEQGKLSGNGDTFRSKSYVGVGSLFNHGTKIERATVVYSQSSIAEFIYGGDYGSVTNASGTSIDYGAIDGIVTEGEVDAGQLVITETEYPLTGLFEFQGIAESQFIRGPYSGKGNINISGELIEKVSSNDIALGTISFTGDAETPRSRDFVGSGSLFHIGDRIEKAVFSYNNSSITTVETSEDYQSITSSATSNIDYGAVDGIVTEGEVDDGQLVITETTQPFGLFNITGNSIDKWQQCFTKIGSGSLFSFNGGIESRTDDYTETTVLFNFTGNLTERFTKGNYAGSGSLFHIGEQIEKAIFSYNTTSIVEGFGTDQYGSITDNATTTDNLGSIGDAYLPPTVDHGDLVILPGEENPFGLFRITGVAKKREINSHVGGGSLFGIGNAAEAAIWQTPEETFLLKMRGGAVEKHIENWVGSGTIKYPEDTPLAPNAAVRFRPHWRGRAFESPITLKGVCGEFFRGSYVGNKTNVSFKILTPNEGFEWRQYRPSPRYVNSVYGKIGGSATVAGISVSQKVNVYGYYGDDRDPGTSGGLKGFSGSAEARTIILRGDETTNLFTFSGKSASKWNPAWTSRPDGSPRLSGTPGLQLRFNIFTNPEGESAKIYGEAVPVRTIIHNGSGSLFAINGSTEIRGFNPSTDTVLFKASGTPLVLFSLLHIGSGSLFGFGSGAESAVIEPPQSTVLFIPSGSAAPSRSRDYVGEGSTSVNGTLTERQTDHYSGSGSLSALSGAGESRAISLGESTVLFKSSGGEANAFVRSTIAEGNVTISDNLDEAFARPYAGEGSLFGFNGAAEAVTVDEESTGLFNFIGDANIVRDRSFAGEGSLFGFNGASEASVISPDLETGLFEITGDSSDSRSRISIGSGSATITGNANSAFSRPYEGQGSLSTLGGGAEVVGFNPDEETFLYEFNGNATSIRARGFAGSGTATVLNDTVVPVIALSFAGEGTLSTFGGAAESRTIDVENTTLFEFRNGATESFTKGNYDTEGSATISGEASDIKLTRTSSEFGYIASNGKAVEKQTDHYTGSGSLFGLSGSTIARAIDYDETQIGQQGEVVSTNLFTFSGTNPGSITRITRPGTLKINLSGDAIPVLKLFSPSRVFGTII